MMYQKEERSQRETDRTRTRKVKVNQKNVFGTYTKFVLIVRPVYQLTDEIVITFEATGKQLEVDRSEMTDEMSFILKQTSQ